MSNSASPLRRYVLPTSLALLFLWSYWPTLARTVLSWQSDPDYSHGFLVIPIAIAIAWRRGGLEELLRTPTVAGLWLVALASLLRIAAAQYYLMPLDAWSIPLWIGGVVWCFFGWPTFARLIPAIAFLWFAAPLPDRAEQILSIPLQQQATQGSAWILQCLRQPAAASGTTLLLGSEVFEVEHACSGLRMFFGSFALATAFMLLAASSIWTSFALILLAAPIAILANILRIVATALMYEYASTDLARRFAHDFAGLMMVGVVAAAFALFVWGAERTERLVREDRRRAWRILPIWPVGIVAVSLAAIVWHHQQQEIVDAALLKAAEAHEEAGDWRRAIGYLRRYLQLNQDDRDALRRLGNAMHRDASRVRDKRRALTVMTAAWQANPDDLQFATQHAELALELGRYSQVVDTTSRILSESDDRVEYREIRRLAARWRAISMYELLGQANEYSPYTWQQVVDALGEAILLDPGYPQHSFRRAITLRERLRTPGAEERNEAADLVIDQLVSNNPDSAEAWLVRYRYRRRYHRADDLTSELLASIDGDLNQAIALDVRSPRHNVHVLVAAAERAHERGDGESSLNFYQQALEANPRDVRPYLAIAAIQVELNTGESRDRAVEVLERGLVAIGPNEVALLFPLMEQLTLLGRDDDADRYDRTAERAIESYAEPGRTSYRIQLQHVRSWRLAKHGEFAAAAEALQKRLSSLSSSYQRNATTYLAQSWANTAQYFRMAGDWERVSTCYRRAAALDDHWRMEYRWAQAHRNEVDGDLDSALRSYRDIAITEATLDAWLDAASVALRQQVSLPPALRDWSQFRRAIDSAKAIAEDRIDEVVTLEINQWLVMDQSERAVAVLTSELDQRPKSRLLYRSLALVHALRGDHDEAMVVAKQLPSLFMDNTDSVVLQKLLLCQQGRFEEAIDLLNDAIAAETPKQLTELYVELASLHAGWTLGRGRRNLRSSDRQRPRRRSRYGDA